MELAVFSGYFEKLAKSVWCVISFFFFLLKEKAGRGTACQIAAASVL